ncbi:MAG: YaiI/YqxD family protein [Oscillospiraceae bacterium]|nr:YaiI/YqxD family protein [Oscillospiraceae bacterium]
MRILIDADGCPVVDIAVRMARQHSIECLILCDTSHEFRKEGATTITVSKGADSVDFALVNLLQKGDVVVTQDYGLAAMCLARGTLPLNQDGMIYSNSNIDGLLHQRHAAQKIRRGGGRLKGPPKRTAEQDRAFERAMLEILCKEDE